MKTLFQTHWDEALINHSDSKRYEIVEIGWEQHVLIDHQTNTVYRYPRRKSASEKLSDEVELLKSLSKYDLPLKIPVMRSFENGYASYDYIEGDVLDKANISSLTDEDFISIGSSLGNFLYYLHQVDKEVVENKKTKQTTSLLEYYSKRIESAKNGAGFYGFAVSDLQKLTAQPTKVQVVVHGDLHGLNMIIEPQSKKLVGIIDFSEVEIGDPNQDFRKIFMADERLLVPAIQAYSLKAPSVLSEERIKLWAYVNEWANLCYLQDKPQVATYKRAEQHLKIWGKL